VTNDSRLRIVVGGFLGLLPAGGITWDYIQYPLGLLALGHDVFYVEDTRLWPIYQEAGGNSSPSAANVAHLQLVMEAFGLGARWAYRDEVTSRTFGLSDRAVADVCRSADVFINVSCATFIRDEYQRIPVRLLVDTDPMFTQIQHHTQSGFTEKSTGMRNLVAGHTHHFTFGESIGAPDCRIPTDGVTWVPTRQPICLDQWPDTPVSVGGQAAFTTVMNWKAGRTLEYEGETWGQKDVEFMHVLQLPLRVQVPLTVVVGQTGRTGVAFPADIAELNGWHIRQPNEAAAGWMEYRRFIQESIGEFSVAKETYVKARTGWFSCRSACYLASARPVVTQDTGWTSHIPPGDGLFAFSTMEEAVSGIEAILTDPARHSRAARELAREFFDSRKVLGAMLASAGVS